MKNKNRQNLTLKGLGIHALARLAPAQAPKGLKSASDLSPLLVLGFATASCGGGGSSSSSPPSNPPPPFTLPDDVPLALYENHPTNKAVYDATPQGQSAAEIDLPVDTADNNLFRFSDDGRIWFETSPDYEAETDSNSDGVYIIRITHSHNAQGYTEIEVMVGDVEIELTPERWSADTTEVEGFEFNFAQVEDILPQNDFVKHLLRGFAFTMPESGPVSITWSLVTPTSDLNHFSLASNDLVTNNQSQVDYYREKLVNAFAMFERAANIEFLEVDDNFSIVGHLRIFISPVITARTITTFDEGTSTIYLLDDSPDSTYVHEIGHALGLKHPFEVENSFPGDPDLENRHDLSVMNYGVRTLRRMTQNDVEALQFLYGAPDTDYEGLQSKLEDIGVTPEIL